MDALEHVLKRGSAQLQEFAATSDFSGENIAFLGAVRTWKDTWSSALDESQIPNAFNQALRIYMTFISIQDADFPLNISSQSLDALKTVFEAPTRLIFGEKRVNSISPFVDDNSTPPLGHITDEMSSIPTYTGKVPPNFNIAVFDDIEDHIKWLVLTNTWPKFINTVRRRSIDTDRTSQSLTSVATLGSQLFDRHVKPIFAS